MYLPSSITLKPGDSGDFVAEMQRRLSSHHLMTESEVTGFYDGITTRAVKAFQAKYGLSIDGIAGPATLRTLNTLVSTNSGDVYSGGNEEQETKLSAIEEDIRHDMHDVDHALEEQREREMLAAKEAEALRDREISHDKTDELTRSNEARQEVQREGLRDTQEVREEVTKTENLSKEEMRRANEEQSRKAEAEMEDPTRHAVQDQPEKPKDKGREADLPDKKREEQLANARDSLTPQEKEVTAKGAEKQPQKDKMEKAEPERAEGQQRVADEKLTKQETVELKTEQSRDMQRQMLDTEKAIERDPTKAVERDQTRAVEHDQTRGADAERVVEQNAERTVGRNAEPAIGQAGAQHAERQFSATTRPTTMGVASMDPKLQELEARLKPHSREEAQYEGKRLHENGVEELPLPGDRMPQEISPSQTPARAPAPEQVAQI